MTSTISSENSSCGESRLLSSPCCTTVSTVNKRGAAQAVGTITNRRAWQRAFNARLSLAPAERQWPLCLVTEPAVHFRHGGSLAHCIDSGRLRAVNPRDCRARGGILITRCLVLAGDEQGQGQPSRVSELTAKVHFWLTTDRFDVGRDCLLKLSVSAERAFRQVISKHFSP